jgi:hypothetical protein
VSNRPLLTPPVLALDSNDSPMYWPPIEPAVDALTEMVVPGLMGPGLGGPEAVALGAVLAEPLAPGTVVPGAVVPGAVLPEPLARGTVPTALVAAGTVVPGAVLAVPGPTIAGPGSSPLPWLALVASMPPATAMHASTASRTRT